MSSIEAFILIFSLQRPKSLQVFFVIVCSDIQNCRILSLSDNFKRQQNLVKYLQVLRRFQMMFWEFICLKQNHQSRRLFINSQIPKFWDFLSMFSIPVSSFFKWKLSFLIAFHITHIWFNYVTHGTYVHHSYQLTALTSHTISHTTHAIHIAHITHSTDVSFISSHHYSTDITQIITSSHHSHHSHRSHHSHHTHHSYHSQHSQSIPVLVTESERPFQIK